MQNLYEECILHGECGQADEQAVPLEPLVSVRLYGRPGRKFPYRGDWLMGTLEKDVQIWRALLWERLKRMLR